ncbi:MAG: tRNA (N(6)-L-threonylcarbamoyladenosine(37)-C(2))-methylthiotransferase MtaB [Dysgonamonadaceae bacterium]|nr:tRNA (N(6)-L-threonylcarbamoyladenosine(37)-C(2))-methylthiotransferase MtaB [Dysgonamonadaceae bacterium]
MIDTSTFENKKAAYFTLGCKLNFAETSTIGKLLSERGVRKAAPGETADVCIVNTCSVTELADKKCRQAIRKISRQHPGAAVIVTGCYAQLKPDEVAAIEGVDLVLGTGQKMDIPAYLDRLLSAGKFESRKAVSEVSDIESFVPSCSRGDRTRYFLKVQDGCNYYCSYCTIPFARGRSRNGAIDALIAQAEEAGRAGGKEIVLTGVNIGDFGRSTGETFFDLLKALDKVSGIARFRISSIEPNLLTDEILEFVASSVRIAPHFHIPLQSGSDEVLRLMKRKYDTELFAARVSNIKRLMPDAFIGVDVIVGVRGETDAHFDRAEAFIKSLDISRLHVFTYSERPGTQALKIEHVVDPKKKQERSRRLLKMSEEKIRRFYLSQLGKQKNVLFEHTKRDGKIVGFTENYVKVEALYDKSLVNKVIPVSLERLNEEGTAVWGMKNVE